MDRTSLAGKFYSGCMIDIPALILPKKHHFGLSIGRVSLRAIEVDSHGKIKTSIEVPIPEGTIENGILLKKDIFIDLLTQLIKKGRFSSPYVSVCFSEVFAYVREYTLPVISKKDLGEAISWNIADLIPFPKEDIYFDWKLVYANDTEYKVMVVAIQRKILDPLVDVLTLVGLKPLRFEPGTSASARMVSLKAGESVLIVEINRKGAYVVLVQQSKIVFTTVVAYTQEDTSETYLANIVQTITEISQYYKNKGLLVETKTSILLSGELATADWAKALAQRMTYQVKIMQISAVSPAFNKAYVAATGNIEKPEDAGSINLLPAEIQKHYDQERAKVFYTSILIRSGLVVLIYVLSSIAMYIGVKWERQRFESNVQKLTQSTKVQGSEIQKLLSLNANAANVVALAPLRFTPYDRLLVLRSIIPEGITITQWEYDDAKLQYSLSGVAKDRDMLLVLKEKLEQTGEFAKVTLPLGSLETPANVRFTMTFLTK